MGMELGSIGELGTILTPITDALGAFGDIFGGLDYFFGGDFDEAFANGFMY